MNRTEVSQSRRFTPQYATVSEIQAVIKAANALQVALMPALAVP